VSSYNAGDIVTVDFPGVTGTKRRPAVVLSSPTYHDLRPDILVGLLTSQLKRLGATDHILQDWKTSGLKSESAFRSFIFTIPTSTNILCIGHLSERDWQAVRLCVKVSLAELDDQSQDNE
jgi:mRNA interferase MazF